MWDLADPCLTFNILAWSAWLGRAGMSLDAQAQKLLAQYQQQQEVYQSLVQQRVLLEAELKELKKVLEELEKLPEDAELYKNVGHVLYKTKKDDLVKEIKDKIDLIEVKLAGLKKQEELVKSELEKLRQQLQKVLSGGGLAGGG